MDTLTTREPTHMSLLIFRARGGAETPEELVIPSSFNGKQVSAVSGPFYGADGLKRITIESGVLLVKGTQKADQTVRQEGYPRPVLLGFLRDSRQKDTGIPIKHQ